MLLQVKLWPSVYLCFRPQQRPARDLRLWARRFMLRLSMEIGAPSSNSSQVHSTGFKCSLLKLFILHASKPHGFQDLRPDLFPSRLQTGTRPTQHGKLAVCICDLKQPFPFIWHWERQLQMQWLVHQWLGNNPELSVLSNGGSICGEEETGVEPALPPEPQFPEYDRFSSYYYVL